MPAQVTGVFRRLAHAVREFTVAQRTIALIGLAAVVLGGIALGTWLTRPAFAPLFSGLAASDASEIVDQLRTDGVPYELTDGGSTIMVPADRVDQERLQAASAGLPSADTGGYALLDSMGVTSSEFQQSVTYKRALEGELATTIEALEGVSTASVRLAIPEETVFVEEAADPTASVFVDTERGVTLTSEQVQAIVHLTSASVDRLDPDNVAVVDAEGTVLSSVGVGAAGGAAQQASDYEKRVQESVQSMLDRVVGSGNATVVVTADMSAETAQRVEETFTTPEGAPVLNESTTSENYAGGAGGGATGVLGPDNIAVPGGADGQGEFTSDSATRNNAVNKVTETRNIPAGAIDRQTVSVALNEEALDGVSAASIQDLVVAAAGIDIQRGDAVTVESVPFTTAGADEAAAALAEERAAEERAATTSLITTGIVVLGAILLLITVIAIVRRARRRATDLGPLDAGALDPLVDDTTAQLESAGITLPMPTLPTAPTEALVLEPTPIDRVRADVDALASASPERTAEFLRNLMDDRQPV
ncbi:flagellar M-ring protein FliF [Diaminobutyricimonas aerilata]|uniref:Flagellar M-ring protein n=1 Tax=Diaminobutyricimonas aerilata TaxID=1162967 RepID=A0A2M9CN12_9MICO|nr:flagellar basal-body MS-ring/collar protein FliF [Diaminobutyricimonas aerilata]PJJ73290.1 flagellar M-ring protein FliF [Diaminobutyricimonas aerilata]